MRVYLDWNATTPPLPEVVEAMATAAASAWGNPASVHGDGRRARVQVESAREAVAALAKIDPRDVVLTSGGTEANNLALASAFPPRPAGGRAAAPWLVTSRLEHPSVTRVAEALERESRARVRWLPVSAEGIIRLEALEASLRDGGVALIAVQSLNHETGVVQPTHEVARLARDHGALFHIDAVQAWGKLAVDESDGDTRSLAAHKIRGPKGIGALLGRPGVKLEPVLRGGAQERGLRPGTVDPVASAGLSIAARHAVAGASRYESVAAKRDRLESGLLEGCAGARVNGAGHRAPHVTNIAFAGCGGPELVAALDLEGVSVSSGSACSAGTSEPSPVLTAMFDAARASQSVRFSLGDATSTDDVDRAVEATLRVLSRAVG